MCDHVIFLYRCCLLSFYSSSEDEDHIQDVTSRHNKKNLTLNLSLNIMLFFEEYNVSSRKHFF